jgi:hypothetical protein
MSQNTRIQNKYLEDIDDCRLCLHYKKRGGHGYGRSKCEFEDIRQDCIAHGRIKRKAGWNKQCRA